MSSELARLKELYEIFLDMEKYSVLLPTEKRLSDFIRVTLDKEHEVVYLKEQNQERKLNSDGFKINLICILESVEDFLDNSNIIDRFSEVEEGKLSEEEYIKYAGGICLARGKYDKIISKLYII